MSHKKHHHPHHPKERYIEYPEVEIITSGDEGMEDNTHEKKQNEQETQTVKLTRFHFFALLLCGVCVFTYRLIKLFFASFFALMGAFRNEKDNLTVLQSYEQLKEISWRCVKMGLGALVPAWGVRFFK